jgi:hypothetical protein
MCERISACRAAVAVDSEEDIAVSRSQMFGVAA